MIRLRAVVAMAIAVAVARPLAAQRTPGEVLSRAVILYEELQLERAVTLLREVTSPSNTATTVERVQAMKYLGAAFALLGSRDSALAYYRAALERDPFTDLDAAVFTAQERQLFAIARRRTFVAGVRTVADSGFVPGRGRAPLQFVATQHARMQAVVRRADGGEAIATFRWTAEGASESPWDGLDQQGARLPAGRYLLEATATATADSARDTVALRFDVRYDHEPLEDTLTLDAGSLLPERQPPSVARSRLAIGLAAAAFAVAVPIAVGNDDLSGTTTHANVMATVTVSAGIAAFIHLRRGSAIPSNVLENARRREEHARHNREIRDRNAARLAQARMRIAPASGDAR
jgi:tetratricopeptide (TPR) repeat protein